MKFLFSQFISILLVYSFSSGCSEKNKTISSIKINVSAPGERNTDFKLFILKNLDETTLAESKLDSVGNGKIESNLSKPIFSSIQIGSKYSEVYLFPGYDMVATIDSLSRHDKPIKFIGNGSDVNNYLAMVFFITEKIKMAKGKYISTLGLDEFNQRFDSLSRAIKAFHLHYTDSIKLANNLKELLERKNNIKFLAIRQEYAFALYNDYLSKHSTDLKNNKVVQKFIMPNGFQNITDEVPFDTAILNMGIFEYNHLLQLYLYNKIYNSNFNTSNNEKDHYISKADEDIRTGGYTAGIKEYLLAINIKYWMMTQGITPATNLIFKNFKEDYPNSAYSLTVQKNYNEWLAIAPGNPAPDFSGTTPDGKNLSLTDLKGKVVYVDVWATWCGPCIEEIPDSKKMQKEFEGNTDIEFLNVSIDRDKAAWKKFLLEDKTWKGLHLHQQEEEINSFWKAYKMAGVPTYILIDQDGKIVNAKASRPSEGKIKDQIDSLLNKKI